MKTFIILFVWIGAVFGRPETSEEFFEDFFGDKTRNILISAIIDDNFEKVNRMFESKQISPNVLDEDGDVLLAHVNSAQMAELLIKYGVDVNGVNKEGYSILHFLVLDGDARVIETLIKAGANVNALDKDKGTPLHWAAVDGSVPIVDALIKGGADINAKDNDGRTPLDLAIRHQREAVKQFLMKAAQS